MPRYEGDVHWGDDETKAMAASSTGEWIPLTQEVVSARLVMLWTGSPTGTFSMEGMQTDSVPIDINAEVSAQPDGTSYTGDINAEDLSAEDLGESVITLGVPAVDYIRVKYTASAGSGTMRGSYTGVEESAQGVTTPADLEVPTADSSDNDTMRDVIGNKTDTVSGDSLVSQAKNILADLLVPSADSADNVNERDVIGNKTDTNAGDSLYALEQVPAADSSDNVTSRDVVGNKTDTVSGDSLISLLKIAAAAILVPSADSADNVNTRDVVGNKTDTVSGDSLVSQLKNILADLLVPSADSADNVNSRDVIGNKTDTVSGDSIIALLKIAAAAILVPSADSSNNLNMRDIIGNKTDTHSGDSLYSVVKTMLEHMHTASKVYPTLADGVTLTCVNDATTWTLGTVTEIVPASTITSDFDIHHVSIEDISAVGVFELVLYYGAGDTECGRVRFTKTAAQDSVLNIPIVTPLIPANSRIRAAIASDDDNGQTVDVSIFYHTY